MSLQHKYALPAGFHLRHYVIARLLGHGGFGLTYLADDTKLNRQVAIKELLPVDFAIRETDGTTVVARSQQDESNLEWARQRFVEEGQTLAALHHPSILTVHDIFEEHGTAYLVTAFVDGGSMEAWLREVQHPAESDLRSITHHILDALALVHERGYLHRDVKPQNILMDRRNGLPILIDFGNARIASGAKTSNLTSVLTKGYAPFEQYQTKGRQGPFSDLYSLGAVLYRAIKGVAPEDAADRWDDDKVEPLCQQPTPGYVLAFLATVDKALRMRREDRWQNCGDWKAALSVPDQPPPSPPTTHESELPATPKPPQHPGAQGTPAGTRASRSSTVPAEATSKEQRKPSLGTKTEKQSYTFLWVLGGVTAGLILLVIVFGDFSTPSQTAVNPESSIAQPDGAVSNGGASAKTVPVAVSGPSISTPVPTPSPRAEPVRSAGTPIAAANTVESDKVREYRAKAVRGDAVAQTALGDCYYYGHGVQKNLTEAVHWNRKAAEQGFANAQYNLGYCYHLGQGVEKNLTEAVQWYRKSADQGNANAQGNLGYCYYFGQGVEQNFAEAIQWYRRAADQGNDTAQCNLGDCYAQGEGVDRNYIEAFGWYNLASKANKTAEASRIALEKEMSPQQIVDGQKRTNELRAEIEAKLKKGTK